MSGRFVTNLRKKKYQQQQSIRKSKQCISDTLLQKRCRKRTAHTPKCWIHLAKQDNLRIKPSQIPNAGKGLFSWKKTIPSGRVISKYTGRRRTREQIDRKYGNSTAKYAICKKGLCVDANHTTDAAGRFANDARNTQFRYNSSMRGNQMFRLKSSQRIPPHSEIFVNYGDDYWL
ncbi:SET domain-containing [Paramuricea clavata]|uniref:SET domain-containing n=1 Tax=Paramuricea clavata TaxID=317549 RepID=A0A6S7HVD1_PARCT|nr:SET domain-containing [Paramuricea clavata]